MKTLRQMGAKIGSRVRFIEDPQGQWRTVKTDAELDFEHLLPWVVENRTMTDTTHNAPDNLKGRLKDRLKALYDDPREYSPGQISEASVMALTCIEELEAALAQQDDLVRLAVAAALTEAINRVSGCDRISDVQPAILALIRKGGE